MVLSEMTEEKRGSVAFLTALNDHDLAVGGSNNSTFTVPAAVMSESASNANSNSRGVESSSRDSRRGRDVKSAEVDLVGYQPLPGSVKLSSITEKVLREAPFAVGSSKAMWRAFLTSRPFSELTTDGFWFVIAHEILSVPVNAARSPRFSRMAHVYCHMFANAPPVFKDIWGSCFFEAWALTLLLLLQDCFPKSKPKFDNPTFRMRLLDLCAEWTLGIRPCFPLAGHWVLKFDKQPPTELELLKRRTFGDGLSGSVSTSAIPSNNSGVGERATTAAGSSRRSERIPEHRLKYVPSRSVIEFGNSPLVHQHLNLLTGGGNASVTPIRLQVTGEATRTMRPFHEIGLQLAKDRIVRTNAWRAAQAVRFHDERPATADVLSRIDQRREELLRQHASSKKKARREISRMKADAADDRKSITAEATDLLSKGDVHEFSNFLVKDLSKTRSRPALTPVTGSGARKARRLPGTTARGGGGAREGAECGGQGAGGEGSGRGGGARKTRTSKIHE